MLQKNIYPQQKYVTAFVLFSMFLDISVNVKSMWKNKMYNFTRLASTFFSFASPDTEGS